MNTISTSTYFLPIDPIMQNDNDKSVKKFANFDKNLKLNQILGQKNYTQKTKRANNHRNNLRFFFSGSERKPVILNNIRGEMSHLPGQMKKLPLK